jgi:anaphase-promoting complex subunit 2
MITALQFQQVFQLPEAPTESDYEISSNWLMNHGHKEPSQRVRAAIKSISKTNAIETLIQHYKELMRSDCLALGVSDIAQLRKIKDYFIFPLFYLNLPEYSFVSFERCLNSLIKSKINSLATLSASDVEFLNSIDWDLEEYSVLNYENQLDLKISSFRGIWNKSVLDEFNSTDLSNRMLANLRISEMCDIVLKYPESTPALYDLKNSIDPSQRSNLITAFTNKCSQKLLHAGTNTNDLILFFISTIKSFLIIDPRAVLLDNASRPIRKYLKERDDTIRNIVHGLLNYDETPLQILSDELSKQSTKTINNSTLDWFPDPIDALPDFRKQDIIESLISIFDSKEIFITELVKEFSKKLLAISKDYNIDDIKLKLDQLKWKFEDKDLNNLDIMIKDIIDSDAIDSKIHQENPRISPDLHFSLLSYLYWPELSSDYEFNPPSVVQQQIDLYFHDYKESQKGRVLKWVDNGVVLVELELEDRTVNLDVTPSQASVIYCFNDNITSLSTSQISGTLNMPEDLVIKCLNYWIQLGILEKVENDRYHVLEFSTANNEPLLLEKTTREQPGSDSMEKYWPFIVGMLRNIGEMESVKIQNFLTNIIAKESLYTSTLHELEEFLQKSVKHNKLDFSSGKYSLKR